MTFNEEVQYSVQCLKGGHFPNQFSFTKVVLYSIELVQQLNLFLFFLVVECKSTTLKTAGLLSL